MGFDLDAARIEALPAEAFYIADFVSEEEEEALLQKITTAPLPRWTHLSHRRLQTWPSSLTQSNALIAAPLPPWLSTPIISPRFEQLGIFADAPHKAPNHVLVNEYRPGQGIMPHEDGAAYFPLVATVSLGAAGVLDLYEKKKNKDRDASVSEGEMSGSGSGSEGEGEGARRRQPKYRILQERRSLLVTRKSLYTDFLHGIAETERDEGLSEESVCNWGLVRDKGEIKDGVLDRGTRVSLTYRDVIRVAKLGGTMKFLGK